MSEQIIYPETEIHLKKLIKINNINAKKFRNYGCYCAIAIVFVSAVTATIATSFISCWLFKDRETLALQILFIAFAIIIVVLAISAKTAISIANAYSLRCGQLEDINILLKLTEKSDVSLDDSLKIMLLTKRDFIRDMVNSSVPDFASILNRLSSKNRDEAQKKSKDEN